jgi:hypothetical protein
MGWGFFFPATPLTPVLPLGVLLTKKDLRVDSLPLLLEVDGDGSGLDGVVFSGKDTGLMSGAPPAFCGRVRGEGLDGAWLRGLGITAGGCLAAGVGFFGLVFTTLSRISSVFMALRNMSCALRKEDKHKS